MRITGAMEIRRTLMIDKYFPSSRWERGLRGEGLARARLRSLTQTLSQRERASKLN